MTRNDTIKIIAIIVMAYPSFDKFKDEGHIEALTSMWAEMFKDDDAVIVSMAVRKHISTSKWPPSIAEIREDMIDIQRPDLIPPDRAWAVVVDVMRSKGEFIADDLHDVLPPMIARAVKRIGWRSLWDMRIYDKAGADRAAFLSMYKPVYDEARQKAILPAQLSADIERKIRAQSSGGLKQVTDAQNN